MGLKNINTDIYISRRHFQVNVITMCIVGLSLSLIPSKEKVISSPELALISTLLLEKLLSNYKERNVTIGIISYLAQLKRSTYCI